MKIGIIAGNRKFPVFLAQQIKAHYSSAHITAVCFKGETSPDIARHVDMAYWLPIGQLGMLRDLLERQSLDEWILAGQISPWRIFRPRVWDNELRLLIERINDFRPHSIFAEIIRYLEEQGITFLDSTVFLKDCLAPAGGDDSMVVPEVKRDITFGVDLISRYVELDVGQTIVVKKRSAVALEGLEGTDSTIKRGYLIAGKGCTVLKFSKRNQDFRFDVPVVGIATLKRLRKIRAAALVLEAGRVLILEKERFFHLAQQWGIAVLGKDKVK